MPSAQDKKKIEGQGAWVGVGPICRDLTKNVPDITFYKTDPEYHFKTQF